MEITEGRSGDNNWTCKSKSYWRPSVTSHRNWPFSCRNMQALNFGLGHSGCFSRNISIEWSKMVSWNSHFLHICVTFPCWGDCHSSRRRAHIVLSPLNRPWTSPGHRCLFYSLLCPQHLEHACHIESAQYIFVECVQREKHLFFYFKLLKKSLDATSQSFLEAANLICKRASCWDRRSLLRLKSPWKQIRKGHLGWKRVEKGIMPPRGRSVGSLRRPDMAGGHMERSLHGEAATLCPPTPVHREARSVHLVHPQPFK